MVKGIPVVHEDLRAACHRVYEWGPARMPGHWHLAYLCFVISRIPDIQPWYQRMQQDLEFWEACGFDPDHLPSYRTVHLRFTELEGVADVFERAASHLIGVARTRDVRVGCWWHIDASEAETHAAPQHDCSTNEFCPTRKSGKTPHLPSVGVDIARAIRQAEAEQAADGSEKPVKRESYTPCTIRKQFKDPNRRGRRLRLGRHWWYSRDPDAGTRLYERKGKVKRVWHGYLHIDVVDHLTGGLLCSRLIPADHSEARAYADVYQATTTNTGCEPLLVAGDKGYSTNDVYRHNSQHGVGSVFPFRRGTGTEKERHGTDRYDAYGIPICGSCGGDTRFHAFAVDRGMPRLWFRCMLPKQPGCTKVQTIGCDLAPRYLLPVWRNEQAYAAMRNSHSSYEHKHRSARIQYLTAPDTLALRPKRPGIRWQQLRANAAVLIDWLRILRRAGWDGSGAAPRTGRAVRTTDGGMPARVEELRAKHRGDKAPPPGPPDPAEPEPAIPF